VQVERSGSERGGGVLATFTIRDNFLALAVQDCQDLATDGESSQHRAILLALASLGDV